MSDQFDIPVILIIYNRSKYLNYIISKLKVVKPNKIYISADGPKDHLDKEKCETSRKFIEKNITWDCLIKKNYRQSNIGLKANINEALDWFFSNELMGIILEDDCDPSFTFFQFCKELLLKYKNEKKIKMISGNFYYEKEFKSLKSYFFSKRPGTHGWATWKRSWVENNQNMTNWRPIFDFFWLLNFFNFNFIKTHYFYKKFQDTYNKKINSWDYQLLMSIWKNNGMIIKPFKHLCKHVGWGSNSTHGKGSDSFPELTVKDIDFPLVHPLNIECSNFLDNYEDNTLRKMNFKNYLMYKFKNKIKRILKIN